jgi:Ca2+-binding RTX toxin-like protein
MSTRSLRANDTLLGNPKTGSAGQRLQGFILAAEAQGGTAMAILPGTSRGETIRGTPSADVISGRGGNDRLLGLGGADILNGGSGDDRLFGGPGNDILRGGAGADELDGGGGNDNLDGGGVNNRLSGGAGNDTLFYNPGAVDVRTTAGLAGQHIDGGSGRDTLRFSNDAFWDNNQQWGVAAFHERGAWRLIVGEFFADDEAEEWDVGTFGGIETLVFDTDQRVTYGAFGTDTDLKVFGGTSFDTFFFGEGTEIIDGRGAADEYYFGRGGGDDVAVVGMGADIVRAVIGAPGNKSILGFGQDDFLETEFLDVSFWKLWDISRGDGRTVFSWEGGSLTIDSEDISGGTGGGAGFWGIDLGNGPILDGHEAPVTTRTLVGTPGPDVISGDARNDRIVGRAGDDVLHGGAGDDVILGQGGNDILRGDDGRDILRGGNGNDNLDGEATANDVFGDAGDDILIFDPQVVGLVTQDFPFSYIEGGAGFDILHVVNQTKLEREGIILPGLTGISMDARIDHNGNPTGEVEGSVSLGNLSFGDTIGTWLLGIERYQVDSDGPVRFEGFGASLGPDDITTRLEFVGGRSDGMIEGSRGPDYLKGGDGNDRFSNGGGSDMIVSGISDEDLIGVQTGPDRLVVTGFNGAGGAGGDELVLQGEVTELTATEDGDGTLISWSYISDGSRIDGSVHVDALGLIEGIDYGYGVGGGWLERTVLPDYGFVA